MGLREELCRLVGWGAKDAHPSLRTCAAYDIAYHAVYDALPLCRSCLRFDVRAVRAMRLTNA